MGCGPRFIEKSNTTLTPCPQCGKMLSYRSIWMNPSTGAKSYKEFFCSCGYIQKTKGKMLK